MADAWQVLLVVVLQHATLHDLFLPELLELLPLQSASPARLQHNSRMYLLLPVLLSHSARTGATDKGIMH
jgi:hypothetical protein